MSARRLLLFLAALLLASGAFADWQNVAPGVDYQEFREDTYDIHVVRIDLTNDAIQIIGTRESDKGTKVSDYARKIHAIAAINADYFDDKFNPIGLTVGPCGEWENSRRTKREGYVAIGNQQARIARQSDVDQDAPADEWMETAVSGWPALIVDCTPLGASELPGSDAFTRSPHPRSAAGLSRDHNTLYLVVADGRRTGVPGMTLAQLAAFMASRLNACSAINFDGGGSTAMWVRDHIVNRPSDGVERPVADHLAVILKSDFTECDPADEARRVAVMKARESKTGVTVTTITTTTVTKTTTQKPQTSASTPPPPHP